MTSSIRGQDNFSTASFAGIVATFARNTPPTGWLKANGQTLNRADYPALWAAIDPATGGGGGVGNGTTTFTVPDLRGEFIRGWDDGRAVDTGRVFGSAQADEFKSHTHGGGYLRSDQAGAQGPTSGTVAWGANISASGGAETRPRNVALLTCIKF